MYYIEHKGKDLPLVIDFYVLKTICSKLKITLKDIESIILDLEAAEQLFHEALKRGFKIEGKVFDLSDSDLEEIVNESFPDFVKIFGECITNVFVPKKKDKKKELVS